MDDAIDTVSESVSDVFSSLQAWAQAPFSHDMDLTHWALFTGLIVALTVLWMMILKDIKGEF